MMAQMYQAQPKQIAKYLKENGQLVNVAANIRRRKAMKFIFDNMAGAKAEAPAEPEKVAETKEN